MESNYYISLTEFHEILKNMNIFFEYQDDNNIVINSQTDTILFSNYEDSICPVPYAKNPYDKFRPDDTTDLGLDGNLYLIEYFHNGYIMSICAL